MATLSKKKIYVIDTSVLLHDHHSIVKFEENDVVIPITVLEELDKFKAQTSGSNALDTAPEATAPRKQYPPLESPAR